MLDRVLTSLGLTTCMRNCSTNFVANWSNEEMDRGSSRVNHMVAMPPKDMGKLRHFTASSALVAVIDHSYFRICWLGSEFPSYMGRVGILNRCGGSAVKISSVKGVWLRETPQSSFVNPWLSRII